jgi:hypothetical protein
MTLQPRDQRALILLALAVAGVVAFTFLQPDETAPAAPPASADSIALAERRLDRARRLMAMEPARDKVLRQLNDELAARERGLIIADTPQQAQAIMLQIIRRVARGDNLDIRTTEIGPVRPLGDAYGEAQVAVGLECRIEQLLNLLAGLTAQREILATSDLRITSIGNREKTMNVRLTVSAVVPRKLVPEKKGTEL